MIQSVYKNDKEIFLRKSIESILQQSYSDFMLFIGVDGPVNDGINTLLRDFEKDDRIKVLRFPENRGLAHTLNDLLAEVLMQGFTYIARMDSDDISLADRLEKQMTYMSNHPEVDMVGGAINEIDENGEDRGKITKYPLTPNECRDFFAKRNPVAHPTVLFRRSFFEKARSKYPTDFVRNEDTRLWHEGYKHGCVVANIPDVVLNFRMTNDMFKNRRNGRAFAKSQLELRKLIAKDLGYGKMAYVYAYATFLLMISPSWVLKFAYKVLR